MPPKDTDIFANNADPDQTAHHEAVFSWPALYALTYLLEYFDNNISMNFLLG